MVQDDEAARRERRASAPDPMKIPVVGVLNFESRPARDVDSLEARVSKLEAELIDERLARKNLEAFVRAALASTPSLKAALSAPGLAAGEAVARQIQGGAHAAL